MELLNLKLSKTEDKLDYTLKNGKSKVYESYKLIFFIKLMSK